MICDLISFPGLRSPTTTFPTILQSDGSSPSCKDKIRWCSFSAKGLLQLHRELEVGYCRLVTITTDNITDTNEYRNGVGAHWPFLSDSARKIQKDLDIAEYTDPVHNPMIPHTLVLEPGLVIYKIYMGYWFFGRPTVEDLRQDLRAVLKKCRPDWDITTPEMKTAWQEGRKELFYPYGKTFAETIREED